MTRQATLDDISAKLQRADQHITELRQKIKIFWNDTPHRELIDYDSDSAEAFREFHRQRAVPPELMVIAGEVIYQLRSSLDHLICALIVRDDGAPDERSQFPICRFRPTKPTEIRRYERQIRGITRPDVRAYVEEAQPYRRPNDRDRHWLAVLKSLSNTDKHRALVLHVVKVKPKVRVLMASDDRDVTIHGEGTDDGTQLNTVISRARAHVLTDNPVHIVDVERKLATDVAFAKFGESIADYPVDKGLRELRDNTRTTVQELGRFLA